MRRRAIPPVRAATPEEETKVFFMTKRIILAAAASTLLLAGPALAAQTVGASGGVSAAVPALPPLPSAPTIGASVATPGVSASAELTAPPADIAVTPTGSDPLAPATGKAAKAKKRAR